MKRKKGISKLPFPKNNLEDALTVPAAIKEKNAGNPMEPDLIAQALGYKSKGSDIFYYLAASSRDYGMTAGSRDSEKISLTPLGREILYAPDPEAELQKKRDAFLSIELFQKVLDHYKGSSLPEMKYLGNTLEKTFKLSPEYHEQFSKLFRENCRYLGLTEGMQMPAPGAKTEITVPRPSTVTIGEPKKKSTLVAFVILPFSEKYDDHKPGFFQEVMNTLIIPAASEAGFNVKTANRQGSDVIQSTIINDLMDADLVIADLTEHNPNVLFELGIRLAIEKPVALIKATGTGRIFDIDNMIRVYEYNATMWPSTVEKDLPNIKEHVSASWNNRESSPAYLKILRGEKQASI